jgi:hypothetical protein
MDEVNGPARPVQTSAAQGPVLRRRVAAAGLAQAAPALAATEHDTGGVSADEALELLKKGNQELVAGTPTTA